MTGKRCLTTVLVILICVLSIITLQLHTVQAEGLNGTRTTTTAGEVEKEELVHRIKRFLIFNNGGLVKVSVLSGMECLQRFP